MAVRIDAIAIAAATVFLKVSGRAIDLIHDVRADAVLAIIESLNKGTYA